MLFEPATCAVCGDEFKRPLGVAGRPRQVCSETCHKQRAIRRTRVWQKANPDRDKAIRKKQYAGYYQRNRAAQIARSVQYARDNPEWKRAKDSAYRVVRLGSPDAERFTLDEIYERDARVCHLCRKPVNRAEATMDHIVPASLGGPHTRANVALAHRSCNASKGNRPANDRLRLL